MEKTNTAVLLRQIPKVDMLLRHETLQALCKDENTQAVTHAVQQVLGLLRAGIQSGCLSELPKEETILTDILACYENNRYPSLSPVINGTGVILHTNLGRAPLAEEALALVQQAARGYSTLEYDVAQGSRGSRQSHVEQLLRQLTGAEAAMVVNNNAAAVLLILRTVAAGKEVVVSRGELVEVGGSFRIPDVMAQSGCTLREVGATNKTHLRDFETAIQPDLTGALLKVHTSNYRVVGFTQSVDLKELAALGNTYGIPVIADLGSGCLLPLDSYGVFDEPTATQSIKAGADAVSFSGDKLLGGPQCGIIVGKAEYISRMKAHPLARALRIDKLSLAALEGTLRLYTDPDLAYKKIPVLRMLSVSETELRQKAAELQSLLADCAEIIPECSQVGGGSVPGLTLPTYAVAITPGNITVNDLAEKLRLCRPAVIGRISRGKLLLDVRTLEERDFACITRCVKTVLGCETE